MEEIAPKRTHEVRNAFFLNIFKLSKLQMFWPDLFHSLTAICKKGHLKERLFNLNRKSVLVLRICLYS